MGQLDDRARERIRALVAAHGTTQAKLAKVAGWNQSTVSKYLLGDVDADLDRLALMAKYFRRTVCDLIATTEAASTDPEGDELIARFRSLPPMAQEGVRLLLRSHPGDGRPSGTDRRSARGPSIE